LKTTTIKMQRDWRPNQKLTMKLFKLLLKRMTLLSKRKEKNF